MSNFTIRKATLVDERAMIQLDEIARMDTRRKRFIHRAIEAGEAYVATTPESLVVGYSVLAYTFYDHGFVSMLYVRESNRREGVGALLMSHMEGLCQTAKLFTSTNASNVPMQNLLLKLGYSTSGVIDNLDEGDREVIYMKFISHDQAAAFP